MTDAPARQKRALPQQWVDEFALVSSAPTTASSADVPPSQTPPETLGGHMFDKQLDGFLDRFQQEIHAARSLKDDLDRISPDHPDYLHKKYNFKLKMEHIRALFSTEGEDFLASLEKRNPKLTMAACGENTIELAQGIDRLETAVREEETKRLAYQIPPHSTGHHGNAASGPHLSPIRRAPSRTGALAAANVVPYVMVESASSPQPPSSDRIVAPPIPGLSVGHNLNNLTSDETLQLMQSDIQALKLELMRLQRSKVANGTFAAQATPHSLPNRSTECNTGSPYSFSSVSPDKDALPASILANNNVNVVRVTGRATGFTPTYVSHLEQMKSRIEALEKKPLSRRAKSVARLGRTQTMGSMYETNISIPGDENQNPNVSAMITPPRNIRRTKHRSISTSSPLAPMSHAHRSPPLHRSSQSRYSPPTRLSPPTELQRVTLATSSPASTPSPKRPSHLDSSQVLQSNGPNTGLANGAPGNTSPARLFFDAPEEMLSRPQSYAAARDIQRYSLKVARRFVPVGVPDRVISEAGGTQTTGPATVADPEPRAKSAVTVSPTRRRPDNTDGNTATGPTLSDVGTGVTTVNGGPSTIDTSGSGGRVVEEIEGDMWVRKGVVWKRWRRRYASIVSHQFFGRVMCLFSYDSSGGVISTRSQIVVLHGSLCRGLRDTVEISGVQRHVFVLRTSSKEYFFAAESEETRRAWIRELREAAKMDNMRMVPKKGGRSMAFRKRS